MKCNNTVLFFIVITQTVSKNPSKFRNVFVELPRECSGFLEAARNYYACRILLVFHYSVISTIKFRNNDD